MISLTYILLNQVPASSDDPWWPLTSLPALQFSEAIIWSQKSINSIFAEFLRLPLAFSLHSSSILSYETSPSFFLGNINTLAIFIVADTGIFMYRFNIDQKNVCVNVYILNSADIQIYALDQI